MKRAFFSLGLMLLGFTGLYAQSSKVVTAMNALASGEYLKAREAIDIAALNEKTKNEARTWLYRGRIYNLIGSDTTGRYSTVENPLETALESLKTGLAMEDVKNYKSDIADELNYNYNVFFSKGAIAYNAGDTESSYKYFSKAAEANMATIEANPKALFDTGVIYNVGITANQIGKKEEAIAAFQKLVDWRYNEPKLYGDLADLYVEQGRLDDAKKALEIGRTAFPKDKDIMIDELNFYINQNKLSDLVDKLNAAIELDPENAELYFVLGTSHVELIKLDSLNKDQHFDEAEKAFQRALKIKPDRFDVNLSLGALYYNTAIEINKILNTLPLDKQAEYDMLQKERNNLYNLALPYFEKAHQLDPKDLPTMQALKEIYVRLNMSEKAEMLRKEIEG